MLERKFRSFVNGKYIYNVPVNRNGKYSHCISVGFAAQYDQEFPVEEYININDVYHKEIYEGDILTDPESERSFCVLRTAGGYILQSYPFGRTDVVESLANKATADFARYCVIVGSLAEALLKSYMV